MEFLVRKSATVAVASAVAAVLLTGCGGGDPGRPDGSSETTTPADDGPDGPTEPPTPPAPVPATPDPPAPGPSTTRPLTTAPFTPEPPPVSSALPAADIPEELKGEWDGDGDGAARLDKIVFTADGVAELHYNNGRVLTGPAVADGSSLTIHVQGGPITYAHWSIEEFDAGYGYTFENLLLDGVSYVRQISGG
ncbi:hypothetical protein AB0L04_25445 [Streptomyces glaucescens]|uniref:hypothetical protein n=1 Tax=Streptomyces glaucescens TaxID=1907 RepID=UPI00344C96A8